jgi:hypothetical protein
MKRRSSQLNLLGSIVDVAIIFALLGFLAYTVENHSF